MGGTKATPRACSHGSRQADAGTRCVVLPKPSSPRLPQRKSPATCTARCSGVAPSRSGASTGDPWARRPVTSSASPWMERGKGGFFFVSVGKGVG